MARRSKKLDRQLAALQALRDAASDAEVRPKLREALASEVGLLVAEAAEMARERELVDLAPELVSAFERLLTDAARRDPGCRGKQAALDALDHLEARDPAPFLLGWRWRQLEPAYPRAVDTAGGVRTRGAAALARLRHPDVLLVLATLLADPDTSVRQAALQTLAYHGQREGAALAMHKLEIGDEDPMVVAEAITTLLDLAPQWAAVELRTRLFDGNEDEQELISVTLGMHKSSEALALLVAWYDAPSLADVRSAAIAAIGLHRSDDAQAFLLERVATARAPLARAAIAALGIHRYDDRLRRAACEAAARNPIDDLVSEVERVFGASS